MIDTKVFGEIHKSMPKINPTIGNGLATYAVRDVERFVDRVMRCASRGFPKGLTYDGYSHCCPYEQFTDMVKPKNAKTYDVSHTDTYLIKINLSLDGQRLDPRYLALPYIHRGGVMEIRGSRYVISPTLTDLNFTVDSKSIFLPMTQTRLTFNKTAYWYTASDQQVNSNIYYSRFYHGNSANKPSDKLVPLLALYMFTEYGVTETFKRFFDCEFHIGAEEINVDAFPESDWIIAHSTGLLPRGMRGVSKLPCVRVAVRKEDHERHDIKSMLASLFYIVDHCSDAPFIVASEMDTRIMWKRAMFRFIWRNYNELQNMENLDKHLESIPHYMDDIIRQRLMADGIMVDTLYDLFAYLIKNYDNMTLTTEPASTKGKVMSVLPELMFEVIGMITKMVFNLQKYKNRPIKRSDINREMPFMFKSNIVTQCTGRQMATTLDSATDNLLMKISGVVSLTIKTPSSKRASEMNHPAFKMHSSMFQTCSYTCISKSSPTGRGRVNPFMSLERGTYRVIDDPEIEDLIANVSALFNEKDS